MNISYGVACIRLNAKTNKYEILLVKKRNTYAYLQFICGKYSSQNKRKIREMFNNMTSEEKSIILSMNFDFMYYKAFLQHFDDFTTPRQIMLFKRLEQKFKNTFKNKDDVFNLIKNTNNTCRIWEIPKGRKMSHETDIECAVREFEEETNIDAKNYNFRHRIKPFSYTFADCGRTYTYNIYIATTEQGNICRNYIHTNHEILDLRWFDMEAVSFVLRGDFNLLVKNIIKKVKNNKLFPNEKNTTKDYGKGKIKTAIY